jgi:uncharacterized membrane protein
MTKEKDAQGAGQLEQLMGILLRSGVLLSAFVVAIGAVMFLFHHGIQHPHFALFQGQPLELRSVGTIVVAAFHLQPLAIIQFGLLLLIATPITRVLFSLLSFMVQRDWMYIGITAVVLSLLLFGLFGGGSLL